MNSVQIRSVRETWKILGRARTEIARHFFDRLFELDPTLMPMFQRDLQKQGTILMNMLDIAIFGLDSLAETTEALRELGIRHQAYGVRARDYDTVGVALLDAIAVVLGGRGTPEVLSAWQDFYNMVAGAMRTPEQSPAAGPAELAGPPRPCCCPL